jgi:mannose/fructose/N-acetylgalactosamine-specific phosphotransferase system component IIC
MIVDLFNSATLAMAAGTLGLLLGMWFVPTDDTKHKRKPKRKAKRQTPWIDASLYPRWMWWSAELVIAVIVVRAISDIVQETDIETAVHWIFGSMMLEGIIIDGVGILTTRQLRILRNKDIFAAEHIAIARGRYHVSVGIVGAWLAIVFSYMP